MSKGYTIKDSRQDGYCDSSEWKKLLDDCLDCALQYDIWKDYGDYVKQAASGCGIDATPVSASGSAGASTPTPTPSGSSSSTAAATGSASATASESSGATATDSDSVRTKTP